MVVFFHLFCKSDTFCVAITYVLTLFNKHVAYVLFYLKINHVTSTSEENTFQFYVYFPTNSFPEYWGFSNKFKFWSFLGIN